MIYIILGVLQCTDIDNKHDVKNHDYWNCVHPTHNNIVNNAATGLSFKNHSG